MNREERTKEGEVYDVGYIRAKQQEVGDIRDQQEEVGDIRDEQEDVYEVGGIRAEPSFREAGTVGRSFLVLG
jgi:hypothetical protein